jgi:peroxiredoxin
MFKKIVLALCLLYLPVTAYAAEVGKQAPDFEVKDINGNTQSLNSYRGKIVVLEWTNPGCPFVKKHYGSNNMQNLQKYATGKGVIWLSVNSSAPDKEGNIDAATAKEKIAAAKAHPTAYILDPEGTLGLKYGAKTTPHMFVIDTNGKLVYAGAIDDTPTPDPEDIKTAKNYVKAAIDELLAGNSVTTAQTKSYGCSVKYKD